MIKKALYTIFLDIWKKFVKKVVLWIYIYVDRLYRPTVLQWTVKPIIFHILARGKIVFFMRKYTTTSLQFWFKMYSSFKMLLAQNVQGENQLIFKICSILIKLIFYCFVFFLFTFESKYLWSPSGMQYSMWFSIFVYL